MKNALDKKYQYDAIVIGSGIGGLVCACYLARAKLKTLIIEQGLSPGGYCTSFSRRGYRFDAAVHYIGGIKNGSLSKIIQELELSDFRFNQFDPSDKIILSNTVTRVRANPYDTIEEFKKTFPAEKHNINGFFKFIMETNLATLYRKSIDKSFKIILDNFFINNELKSTIGVMLLGNMGLPPSRISAFASIIFFREFLLDPGYYPFGGMQAFADYLLSKYKSYGGEAIFSSKVIKIIVKNNEAAGVTLQSGSSIKSKYVISAIDATQTFNELISIKTRESIIVNKLVPSISIYAFYLGLKRADNNLISECGNIWFFKNKVADIESCFDSLKNNISMHKIIMGLLTFPSKKDPSLNANKEIIQFFTIAPFISKDYWDKMRKEISDEILLIIEGMFPKIKKLVEVKESATPYTFYKYTLNKNGAAFGWASSINQMKTSLLSQLTSIKRLSLVGHWAITGSGQGGISTVAVSGKKVAENIINTNK